MTDELDRDAYWQSCEKVRTKRDLSQLAHDLEQGAAGVDDAELAKAAVALVRATRTEGVTSWTWPPCPTQDELIDLDDWLAEQLSAAQVEAETAKDQRRVRDRLRKAGLCTQAGGPGVPLRKQRLKITLDEARTRLVSVIKAHQVRTAGQFRREWLDPKYPYYIADRDGGLANKQITLMANEIIGNNDERSFDESWEIVAEDMRTLGVENDAFA